MQSLHTLKPPANHGMQVLDRSKFSRSLPLVVADITEPRLITRIGKESRVGDLLDLHRVSRIVHLGNSHRGVLLAPHITDPAQAPSQLHETTRSILEDAGASFKTWRLDLGYGYWTAEDILRATLPAELGDVPTGFAVVGHIAHLNLRDQFLPYKHLIGEVILDKNKPAVRTVVNKLDTINTVYRTFDMEVIAGEPDFMVEQQESGCRFQFDFRKVYWNSRLHTEHDRLVQLFGSGSAICDPFAGVGPFAIPAAKRGNFVFASDLNPDSYDSMTKNVLLNKLPPGLVHTYNEDGRDFIRSSVRRLHEFRKEDREVQLPMKQTRRTAASHAPPPTMLVPEYFSHYVMNLPATAIEFLDAFRGLYNGLEFSKEPELPVVHVHCFFKFDPHGPEPPREEVHQALTDRVAKALGFAIDPEEISLHDVRRVAPAKDMYEVSFRLPREVAYAV